MWRISQWRSTHDTTDTLIVRPRYRAVPRNPRVATHWCHDPLQPRPQKMEEKNPSQLLHSPAHWSIVYFVKRELSFFDCKNMRKAVFRITSVAFEATQSSHVKWYIMMTPETRLDTPETHELSFFLRLQAPHVCPFRRPSIPGTTINLRVRVLKVRFGFWKFVVRLPCCTTPRKCQQLHPHRTLALRARVKY